MRQKVLKKMRPFAFDLMMEDETTLKVQTGNEVQLFAVAGEFYFQAGVFSVCCHLRLTANVLRICRHMRAIAPPLVHNRSQTDGAITAAVV